MSLSLLDLLQVTGISITGNPLRSALTTLGVFMGVGAVSATLQVGNISNAVIAKQLAEKEAPQVQLDSWSSVGLELEDIQFLKSRLPPVREIGFSTGWWSNRKITFQAEEAEPRKYATSENYLLVSGLRLLAGRFFTPTDFENYRLVAVIDKVLAEKLFKGTTPIKQRIYEGSRPFIVIGVIESKNDFDEGQKGTLLIPHSVYRAMTGSKRIGTILIRPYQLQDMKKVQEQAEKLVKERMPRPYTYAWNNVSQILEQQETLKLVSQSLMGVGFIALLVGGVGIANITIASVIERTKEIGLRRAIGATQQDIMLQFILEAVFLSVIGGVSAIGAVHGLTEVVAQTFKLPYKFDPNTAAIALGSAVAVGVGAGFFPALRASQLDPVQALRSE